MRLQPHRLEFTMGVLGELVPLQYGVQFSVMSRVESDDGPCSQHSLALIQFLDVGMRDWKAPKEPRQPLDVPALFQGFAHGGDLVDGERQRWQRKNWSRYDRTVGRGCRGTGPRCWCYG